MSKVEDGRNRMSGQLWEAQGILQELLVYEVTPKSWTPDLWVCCAAQPSR